MAEINPILKAKVRKIGLFDFKETYRVLFEWLAEKGYSVDETKYLEVIQSGGLKEIDVFWEANKNFSKYFKFRITVRFHPLAFKAVEIDVNGVKQKMNQADFTVENACLIIKDYDTSWDSSDMFHRLRIMYDKYLVSERYEAMQNEMITEFEEFIAYMKAFLEIVAER